MSGFDLSSYLQRRTAQNGPDKIADLVSAREHKIQLLGTLSLRTASQIEAEANKDSWVGQIGADPNSFLGERINDAASLVSGTARVAGQVASLVPNTIAAVDENVLSQEDYDAYNRHRAGRATAADMARLNGRKIASVGDLSQMNEGYGIKQVQEGNGAGLQDTGMAPMELFKRAEQARQLGKDITEATDLKGIVHQGKRNRFTKELGASFDADWAQIKEGAAAAGTGDSVGAFRAISGLAGLIFNAGAIAVDNAGAAREFILENLPQIAIGGVGAVGKAAMTASNVGYAMDYYQKGIETYQKEHGGSLPDEQDRLKIAGWAASLAVAEQGSDMFQLAATKNIFRNSLKAAKETGEATRKGFLDSVFSATKAAGEGFLSEAPTEAYQTYAENVLEGKETKARDIYTAGVIGGIAGAGTSGGLNVLNSAADKITTEAQRQKAEELGAQTGKVDAFLDPASPLYAPYAAIKSLTAYAKQADLSPEDKQGAYDRATDIISSMEERKAALEGQNQRYTTDLDADEITDYQAELKQAKEEQAVLAPGSEGFAKKQEYIDLLEDTLAVGMPGNQTKRTTELSRINRELTKARDAYRNLHMEEMAPKDLDVDAAVATIEAAKAADATPEIKAQAQEQAKGITTLSMAIPERVSPETAEKLAADEANELTPQQRTYLKAFAESRRTIAPLETMDKVHKEIASSTREGQMGIAQYRERITQALAAKNTAVADKYLGMLENFAAVHTDKAAVAAKALKEVKTNQVIHIAPVDGKWAVVDKPSADSLEIRKGFSSRLVANFQAEVKALKAAVTEMQLAREVPLSVGNLTQVKKEAEILTQVNNPSAEKQQIEEVEKTGESKSVAEKKDSQVQSNPAQVAPEAKQSKPVKNQLLEEEGKTSARPETSSEPVVEKSPSFPTWNNLKPGDQVTLYRGENSKNETDGQWWTTDRSVAEKFGEVKEVTLPAELVGKHAVQGHNGPHEFIFPTVRPTELSKQVVASPSASPAVVADAPPPAAPASATPETQPAYTGLKVFGQRLKALPAVLAKLYTKAGGEGINLVAQFLSQSKHSERYKTPRALAAYDNFLSAWNAGQVEPELVLGRTNESLSVAERGALRNLKATLNKWTTLFPANFIHTDPDYRYQDMFQYLVSPNGEGKLDVEENVKTAMAFAAYMWTLDRANKPARQRPEELAEMHGFDKETAMDPRGITILQRMDSFRDAAIFELGEIAATALGFTVRPNAPANILPQLKAAMGSHILKMLEHKDVGLVAQVELNAKEVDDYFLIPEESRKAFGKDDVIRYVVFKRQPSMQLLPEAEAIREANVNSKAIADKLFGTERDTREASTEKVDFTQKYAKGTDQEIPSVLRQVIEETMKTPHTVIREMWDLAQVLGRDAMLEIAGFVPESRMEHYHVDNHDAIRSQNDNLARQYDLMVEMMKDPDNPDNFRLEQEFFVELEVWKNFRVGFKNDSLNQQTSKIHRFMFSRPDWVSTITLADADQMHAFYIAIAAALGVKTDRQPDNETLGKLADKLKDEPEIMQAIDAIRSQNYTVEAKRLIQKVASQEEGFMTLQALTAYAAYLNAKEAKEKDPNAPGTFTATMLVGADGKTNGPILTALALGAAADLQSLYTLLNRGGIYRQGESEFTHYSEYAKAGNQDMYEDLSADIVKAAIALIRTPEEIQAMWAQRRKTNSKDIKPWQHITQKQWDALQVITKDLLVTVGGKDVVTKEGRDLVKTPLTAFNYGAGLPSQLRSMEGKFVEAVIAGIEEFAKLKREGKDKRKDGVTFEQYIAAINTLTEVGKDGKNRGHLKGIPVLKTTATPEQFLRASLSKERTEALRHAFTQTLGASVRTTMSTKFSVLIARRDTLNQTLQASFQLYNVAYESLKQKALEAMKDKEVAWGTVDKVERPLHDLSPEQEREIAQQLAALLPQVHHALSAEDDNINAGLFMAKNDQVLTNNPLYTNRTHLAQGDLRIDRSKIFKKDASGKSVDTGNRANTPKLFKDLRARAKIRELLPPGVTGIALAIQSLDSAAMHKAIAKIKQAMNIHDEIGHGITGIKGAAGAINQVLAETMLTYSPAREAAVALERQLQAMNDAVEAGILDKQVVRDILQTWADIYNGKSEHEVGVDKIAGIMLEVAHANAYEADLLRLGVLAEMGFVDQYTWQGGQYEVSETIRAQAKEQLAKLSENLPLSAEETLAQLDSLLAQTEGQGVSSRPDWVGTQSTEAKADGKEGLLLEDTADLSLPGVMAPAVIQALASKFPDLVSAIREGKTVVEAINGLPLLTRAKIIEQLRTIGDLLPKEAVSPYGELSAPDNSLAGDQNLVTFFEANPVISAKQVMDRLKDYIGRQKNDPLQAFKLRMLAAVSKRVDPQLLIKLVTRDTPASAVMAPPAKPSHAWIATDEATGEQEIYLLGRDFAGSNIQVETLLHELSHAALAKAINGALADRSNPAHKDILALIDELGELRQAAKDFVKGLKDPQLEARFAPALSNIHEFIAWGMTNKEFQDQVLVKLPYSGKGKDNVLVTGMQRFIQSLVKFFFGDKAKEDMVNGMTVMLRNTAGILNGAGQVKTRIGAVIEVLSQENVDPAQVEVARIHNYTTTDVFNALSPAVNGRSISSAFRSQLIGLLDGIVAKVHGTTGSLKAELMHQQAATPMDVWLKALDTGMAPFASLIQYVGLPLSEQEQYTAEQVEAVVSQAINDNHAQTRMAYTQLAKLFVETKERLTPADFAAMNGGDMVRAEATWKFIFEIDRSRGNRSDYLARFAALGLASEQFNALLQVATKRDAKKLSEAKSFVDRLESIWNTILEFVYGKVTKTRAGQRADEKLNVLVSQLVDIEAKEKARLQYLAMKKSNTLLAGAENAVKKISDTLKESVEAAANSKLVRESGITALRAAGGLVRTVAGNRGDLFLENMARMFDAQTKERHGILLGYIRELRGPKEVVDLLVRMNKKREGFRKDAIAYTAKNVLAAFANDGKDLTVEQSAALTATFVRTGAHNLLDVFSHEEIAQLLQDPVALHRAIRVQEARLFGFKGYRKFFKLQANALGHLVATGSAKETFILRNAHAISRMFGTAHVDALSAADQAKVEEILKVLVTLRALSYTKESSRLQARQLLLREGERTDGNGVDYILRMGKKLEADSLARLFNNNPTLMVHGYTHDIANPYVETVTANEKDGAELVLQGYTKGERVAHDPTDPDRSPKHLYVRKGGGLASWLTGAMSFTSQRAEGSAQHSGYMNAYTAQGRANITLQAQITGAKQADIAAMFSRHAAVRDLSKVSQTHLVPTLNPDGDVVNWRYLMKEETKDTLLERDNRVDQVLGATAGGVYDKESTPQQNKDVINALHEMYRGEYKNQPESYILVGSRSSDPALKEIWDLLPKQTKQDIRSIWKSDGMWVRKDTVEAIFGYRKHSLAQAFDKDPAARNHLETVFVNVMNFAFKNYAGFKLNLNQGDAEKWAKRAAWSVTKGERAWQEIVSEAKDIIVVRTGVVMLGNIWSNFTLLWLQGVPLIDMLRHHNEAWKGAVAWQDDSEKLYRLKQQVESGYFVTPASKGQMEQEILRLEDALARNPVRELMEAGLMSTIVDDMAAEEDPYSYKSALKSKVDKVTSKLPPLVRDVGKQIYMGPDTKVYGFLRKTTQLSDFMARYSLYQHATTRKKDPLSKDAAIQLAADSFINYDVPMPRGLQYLDDMGVTMFTKYFLRIQRVLAKLVMEKPARVLSMVALNQLVDIGPDVLEGSWIHHFGNDPIRSGMFEYPRAVMQLPALTLLK